VPLVTAEVRYSAIASGKGGMSSKLAAGGWAGPRRVRPRPNSLRNHRAASNAAASFCLSVLAFTNRGNLQQPKESRESTPMMPGHRGFRG
jgi:hypothetical protein